MKSFSCPMMMFFFALFSIPFAQAAENVGVTEMLQRESLPMTMLSGEVKDVQGDWCLVQDSEGTEWKIQVDNYTETIGNVLPGVTIAAMVEPDGHAKEVKVMPE